MIAAIEIKSNATKNTDGLEKFKLLFEPHKAFIVGNGGIKPEDFLSFDLKKIFT